MKRKSRRYKATVSGQGSQGFSLNGGRRSQGWVGQGSLGRSLGGTRFRGAEPMGAGGTNGAYKRSIVNSGSPCTNVASIIKRSSGNTPGLIASRFTPRGSPGNGDKDARAGSSPPIQNIPGTCCTVGPVWVQGDTYNAGLNSSQSSRIEKLKRESARCVVLKSDAGLDTCSQPETTKFLGKNCCSGGEDTTFTLEFKTGTTIQSADWLAPGSGCAAIGGECPLLGGPGGCCSGISLVQSDLIAMLTDVRLQMSSLYIPQAGKITLSNPETDTYGPGVTGTKYNVSSNSIQFTAYDPYGLTYPAGYVPNPTSSLKINYVTVFQEGIRLVQINGTCLSAPPNCPAITTPPLIVINVQTASFGDVDLIITPPARDPLDFTDALCQDLVVAETPNGSPAIVMSSICPESRVPRLLDRCKSASYHIGGKKFVRTMYSKNLNPLAMDQSQYMFSGLMAKNNLPTPPCKSPFPVTAKANKWCGTAYTDPKKAVEAGILPPDWGDCGPCIHSGMAIKMPTVSQRIDVQTKRKGYGPFRLNKLWGQRINDPDTK